MAHLSIVQSFELLDYYYDRWGRVEPWVIAKHGAKQILEENEQRVSLLQKSAFLLSMSAFEAAAKAAMHLPECPVAIPPGRIYLRGIMKNSAQNGLINRSDMELWEFAVELRNCMVHNNAIAEKSVALEVGDGFRIEMVQGQMTQSSPRRGVLLQKSILMAYSRWCDALLSSCGVH